MYGLGIVGCNYGADRLRYAVHYALLYLLSESDPGLACPVTLTAATAFTLDRHGSDAQKRRWMPGLTVRQPGPYIDGATWVTEKQGGPMPVRRPRRSCPVSGPGTTGSAARSGSRATRTPIWRWSRHDPRAPQTGRMASGSTCSPAASTTGA